MKCWRHFTWSTSCFLESSSLASSSTSSSSSPSSSSLSSLLSLPFKSPSERTEAFLESLDLPGQNAVFKCLTNFNESFWCWRKLFMWEENEHNFSASFSSLLKKLHLKPFQWRVMFSHESSKCWSVLYKELCEIIVTHFVTTYISSTPTFE